MSFHLDQQCASICESLYLRKEEERRKRIASVGFHIKKEFFDSKYQSDVRCIIARNGQVLCVAYKALQETDSTDQTEVIFNMIKESCGPEIVRFPCGYIKVHAGFWRHVKESVDEILEYLDEFAAQNLDQISLLVFTGHSVGGAYAILTRTVWVCEKEKVESSFPRLSALYQKVRVVTFGTPYVFLAHQQNEVACNIPEELQDESTGYVNEMDLIPRMLGDGRRWENLCAGTYRGLTKLSLCAGLILLFMTVTYFDWIGKVVCTFATVISFYFASFANEQWKVIRGMVKFGNSEEAKSYMPVGEYRFLKASETMDCRIGKDKADKANLAVPSADLKSMSMKHRMSAYLSNLSRPSDLIALEIELQQRDAAIAVLRKQLIAQEFAENSPNVISRAISQAVRFRYGEDSEVQSLASQVLESIRESPRKVLHMKQPPLPAPSQQHGGIVCGQISAPASDASDANLFATALQNQHWDEMEHVEDPDKVKVERIVCRISTLT
jgi:hypothetical protein